MSECLEVQGALRAVKQAIMSNRVVKGYDIIQILSIWSTGRGVPASSPDYFEDDQTALAA